MDGGINQKINMIKHFFNLKAILILISILTIFSNHSYSENLIKLNDEETNDIEKIIEKWVEKNPEKIRSVLKLLELKEEEQRFNENLNTLSLNTKDLFLGNKHGDIIIYEFFDYNCG